MNNLPAYQEPSQPLEPEFFEFQIRMERCILQWCWMSGLNMEIAVEYVDTSLFSIFYFGYQHVLVCMSSPGYFLLCFLVCMQSFIDSS